jgi:transposase InsO family protein
MYPDQRESSAAHFLAATTSWFQRFGIHTRRILTDNGPCYVGRHFRNTCQALGLKRCKTRPYTPCTNGKDERFIQTALREWAYARTYQNSQERTAALISFIHQYNWHRPYASLNQLPPILRARIDDNNLLIHHI